jgi:hypothetical protein
MKSLGAWLGVAFAAVASVAAALAWVNADQPASRAQLRSIDLQERRAAADALVERVRQARAAAIEELLNVLRENPRVYDAEFGSAKYLAIRALGDLKAEEAVPLLAANVEYHCHGMDDRPGAFLGTPAGLALAQIGMPAVLHLLRPDVVAGATPEQLRRFALVVRYVFPDARTARAFVEAYNPGYTEEARAKHGELKKILAELN